MTYPLPLVQKNKNLICTLSRSPPSGPNKLANWSRSSSSSETISTNSSSNDYYFPNFIIKTIIIETIVIETIIIERSNETHDRSSSRRDRHLQCGSRQLKHADISRSRYVQFPSDHRVLPFLLISDMSTSKIERLPSFTCLVIRKLVIVAALT